MKKAESEPIVTAPLKRNGYFSQSIAAGDGGKDRSMMITTTKRTISCPLLKQRSWKVPKHRRNKIPFQFFATPPIRSRLVHMIGLCDLPIDEELLKDTREGERVTSSMHC
jgi:hypothetical protein